MYVLALVFIFVLGAIIGSFVNVVSLRYNTGTSPLQGRSHCPSCNASLRWYELVPIFSYLLLKGRCFHCNTPISKQYPLIEFLSGLIFVGIAIRQFYYWPVYSMLPHGFLISVIFFAYYAFVFSLLLSIVIYDVRHMVIPNAFIYTFIVLSVAKLLFFFYLKNFSLSSHDFLDLASPLLLFIPFALLWLVSKGKWIGFGDAKLVFGIGAMLGLVSSVSVAVLAFWLGAIWGILLLVKSRFFSSETKVTLRSEVPFAPFLIASAILVFFTRIDVLGLEVLLREIFNY